MSAESISSFDAFYGIEKKRGSGAISFEKCDLSPYSTEDKDSSELCPQKNQGSKLPESSSVELLYVRRSRVECTQSSTSERDSSYYEVLDFINSDKSENFAAKNESNMSHNEGDSEENIESYCKTIPVKSVRKRILSEPAKKKTTDAVKRKVRTIQPKSKLNKTKQEQKSKYVIAEQNADYVTQKLLAARKEKINELRNEIVDIQRQHKNLEDENKILRRINARQQRELNKIEESRDELPELVKAHNEEIRVMKSLLKQARDKCRELEQRMKMKDSELHKKKEELQKVRLLTKNSDLLERSTLHEKVESFEKLLQERDSTIMEQNRKLELLEKNYKRDITCEKLRQKELLNEKKNLQKEYDKLQFSLSLKEKKIEQQNIYCNTRKPGANLQMTHSAYPEFEQIPTEDATPKQQVTNESTGGSFIEKSTGKDLSKGEKCARNFANWNDKTPSSISTQLFSTPHRESRDTHSAYERMTSLLNETSSPAERSAGPSNACNESERPRFEKRLDPKTKARLLSHLKTLNIKDKESSASKEEFVELGSAKRLSPPKYLSDSDGDFFTSYVPSVGDSIRHSMVSNVQHSSQTLGTHNIFSRGFSIGGSPSKSQAPKEKHNSYSLKIGAKAICTSPELTDIGSFEEISGRGSVPFSTSQYKFSDEFLSSSNADAQSSERTNFFTSSINETQSSHR